MKQIIIKTNKTLEKLNIAYDNLMYYENVGDEDKIFQEKQTLVRLAEKFTLQVRDLVTVSESKKDYEIVTKAIKDTSKVEVGFTEEGWFRLSIPALLPRKGKGNVDYVRSLIYPAMERFFNGRSIEKFRNCTIIYLHTYDKDRPKREWRDHDNIEINAVTDIVALFAMVDDNPHVCEHYYASQEGLENRTEVFVLPKRDLERFRLQRRLYDTR